jgi:hypothetical protein
MKTRQQARRLRIAVLGLLLAELLGAIGCSRRDEAGMRALNQIEGGKIVVAGARPEFPAGLAPQMHGFFEDFRWDPTAATLEVKGWAPLDVRPDDVRFVLRDPFDELRLEGSPTFAAQERPDVLKSHTYAPGLLHSGFTARLQVTNPPRRSTWTQSLELYCLAPNGTFYRLQRGDAPARQSWDRRPDRFEIVLTYATPAIDAPEKLAGSLDVFETSGEHNLRLAGWAPFDGQSAQSVFIIQLPATAAPASIVACSWIPRPDVRAAVTPAQPELERSGFDVTLQIRTSPAELASSGRLRLWSIDAARRATEVDLYALKKR